MSEQAPGPITMDLTGNSRTAWRSPEPQLGTSQVTPSAKHGLIFGVETQAHDHGPPGRPMCDPKSLDRSRRGYSPPGAPGQGLGSHRSSHVAVLSLTGDVAALKSQVFVLKEGVDYKVKITFKVRGCHGGHSRPQTQTRRSPLTPPVPQVNKEIVSGLKCLHHTYRQGLRGEGGVEGAARAGLRGGAHGAQGSP